MSQSINEITKKYATSLNRRPSAPVVQELVIGNRYNPNKHTNVYVAHVEFMRGDADGYDTQEIVFTPNQTHWLVEFLNFLSACSVRFPRGKGGDDNYTDVPGYNKWVCDGDAEWEENEFLDELSEEEVELITRLNTPEDGQPQLNYWPYDDGQWCTSFNRAHVTYFDENGNEFEVALLLGES